MNKVITFGEIMLRLSSPNYQRFSQASSFDVSFAGAEANVAVSLANYGINVDFVTRIPNNDIGNRVIRELRMHGVGTDKIIIGGERLGILFVEKGAVNRSGKVIYDRANSAISQIEKEIINWDEVFKDATWFHWTGITPAISQSAADVCMEAIKAANKRNITVSADLNYRKNLWRYGKKVDDVMPELVAGCDILLGNEEDAEMVLGIKPDGVNITKGQVEAEAYLSVSEQIINRFPKIKKVVTTLRGSINANHNTWAGVLYDGDRLFKSPQYDITHIVDRIGGGDSFMGGLIYGLLTYKNDDKKALNFAVAASNLKHTISGDFNLVTIEEVEKLMNGDASGRVSR